LSLSAILKGDADSTVYNRTANMLPNAVEPEDELSLMMLQRYIERQVLLVSDRSS
jgi:hypothetical protein